MENLNAEQIIKALRGHIGVVDMRCEECPYNQDNGSDICIDLLMTDSLALINSQEQRIKELTEENERLTRLANLRQRDLDNANDLLFKVEDENERLKEFAEYIKTAPIVKIDEEVISKFAIKRAIRNYELHFGKSAQLEKIAKEMVEGENEN